MARTAPSRARAHDRGRAQDGGEGTDTQIIRAVGVAAPGVLDMDRGYSIFLPNLPGDWPNVPIGPAISDALGLPVYLINDVRAFTVAELEIGAAKGVTTALCYAIRHSAGGIVAHGRVNMGLGGAGANWDT